MWKLIYIEPKYMFRDENGQPYCDNGYYLMTNELHKNESTLIIVDTKMYELYKKEKLIVKHKEQEYGIDVP